MGPHPSAVPWELHFQYFLTLFSGNLMEWEIEEKESEMEKSKKIILSMKLTVYNLFDYIPEIWISLRSIHRWLRSGKKGRITGWRDQLRLYTIFFIYRSSFSASTSLTFSIIFWMLFVIWSVCHSTCFKTISSSCQHSANCWFVQWRSVDSSPIISSFSSCVEKLYCKHYM